MDARRSSRTAEQVALSRALESRWPESERVCHDPLAERFLGATYRALLVARPLRLGVERLIERLFAGHHGYVVARTRYIDDFLQDRLARGPGRPEQVVILGAGFDSRPYRFADRLRGVAVFEVDHPATSAAKQARIRRMLGAVPPHVTYVPVDFNTQALAAELARQGCRTACPTLFLWEGVTPYLSAAAVDDVLALVRGSGPGSAVLFDYVLASFVAGTCTMHGAANELEKMRRTQEPLVFGIAEGGIAEFLTVRGFAGVADIGGVELNERYFRPRGRDPYVKPWWRIAHAEVR